MEREEFRGTKKVVNPGPKWIPDCLKSMLSDMYDEPVRDTQKARNDRIHGPMLNMDQFEGSHRGSERSKNFTKVTIREGEDFKEFRVQHSLKVKYLVVPEQNIRGNDIHIVVHSPDLSLYVGNTEIYPQDEYMIAISDDRMRYRMTSQGPCQEFLMGPSKCYRYDEPCSSVQCSYSESCPYYDDGRRAILVDYGEYKPKLRERRHSQDRSMQKWNSHENFTSDETFDHEPDYYSKRSPRYKYRYENPHEYYERPYYPKVSRDFTHPSTPNSTPESTFLDRNNYYKSKERLTEGPNYHFREYKNETKSHSGIADTRDPADYYYRPHTYNPSTSYQIEEEPIYSKRKESPYRYEKSGPKSKEDLKTLIIREPASRSKDSVRELVKVSKRVDRSPKKSSKENAQTSEKPIKDDVLLRMHDEMNSMKKKSSKFSNHENKI